MTDEEARKLATRIIDTWPAGPKAYVWRDALIPLDAGYAAATYRRLATEQDKPTIARFHAEYRSMLPTAEGPRRYIDHGAISLSEYLERIAVRAAAGSHEAQAELDRWTRHLGSPSRKRPPTPLEAEQRIEAELEAEQLRFVDPGTNPL